MITSRTRRLAVPIADLFVAQLREISLFDAVSDPVRLQAYTDRPPNVNVNIHVNENVNVVDNVVDNSTSSSVSHNSILQVSTPLSSRFQKASNMIKRKFNDNDNNQNQSVNNKNSCVKNNLGSLNNKSNLVSNYSLNVNDIIDTQHDNSTLSTSTSCDTSMLKLAEISKQNTMKSKFVVPVRNNAEHSAKILNNINIVNNNKSRKKNNTEEDNLSGIQNLPNSNEIKQKTKINNNKSDAVVISSKDNQKDITKKSNKKTQKKGIMSNTDIIKGTVAVSEVANKGKRKLKSIEEIKYASDDDNDKTNDPSNGNDNNDNNNNNNNTNIKNNNNNTNNNDSKKSNLKNATIMNTKTNSAKNKNKNKNEDNDNTKKSEVMNKDKTNESDYTNTAHSSNVILMTNKVAAEKKEDSTTIKAAKNIPRNVVPTSLHRTEEDSLQEEILSDDDSLCLGSDQEGDEIEDKESVVKVKVKGRVREKGKGEKDEKIDDVKHVTISDSHHDINHNNDNSNNDIEDEDGDDDDMFFAE